MFGFGLGEYERKQLAIPIWYWLKDTNQDGRGEIAADIQGVFETWKAEQVDQDGNVLVPDALPALLSFPSGTGQTRSVPANEATAFDVARGKGAWVYNEIDLAFHLWLENYAPMEQLLTAHGLFKVFALIGGLNFHDVSGSSLIRLNGFLVDNIVAIADIGSKYTTEWFQERHARREQTRAARALARVAKKEAAAEINAATRKMGVEYKMANPTAKLDETAQHVAGKTNQAVTTVKKKLAGLDNDVRAEVARLKTKNANR